MTSNDFFAIYFTSLGLFGALAGFVINHLLSEIKRLHARVDDVYNILLSK